MTRSKSFSPAVTLQQLADVFVEHGYEATSLTQLESASGLGKQSLYNAFGDKKAMYLSAVECAVARAAQGAARMVSAPSGRAALQQWFEQVTSDCASDDMSRRSCIVSIGLLEGIDDEDIQQRLRSKWEATHSLLKAQIARGQGDGSITNPTRAHDLADHLMATIGGLRVMARLDPGAARLRRAASQALTVLDHRT